MVKIRLQIRGEGVKGVTQGVKGVHATPAGGAQGSMMLLIVRSEGLRGLTYGDVRNYMFVYLSAITIWERNGHTYHLLTTTHTSLTSSTTNIHIHGPKSRAHIHNMYCIVHVQTEARTHT